MCFAVNFVKFLRTPFPTEYLRWLFLAINSFLVFIQFFGTIIYLFIYLFIYLLNYYLFHIYYLLFIIVSFK